MKEAVVGILKSAFRRGYAANRLDGVWGRFLARYWGTQEIRRGELRRWFRRALVYAAATVKEEGKRPLRNEGVARLQQTERGNVEERAEHIGWRLRERGEEELRPEEWKIIRHRGDGNCLFYALEGKDDRMLAQLRRRQLAEWIRMHPNEPLGVMTVAEWVKDRAQNTAPCSVAEYARRLNDGMWGGVLEMGVYTRLWKGQVRAYAWNNSLQRYCLWSKWGEDDQGPVRRVLYVDESHYNSLVPAEGGNVSDQQGDRRIRDRTPVEWPMLSRSDTESEGLANTRKGQKRNIHAPEDAGLVVGEQRERMAKRRKHLEGEGVEEVEGGDEAESDWYSVLGIQPGCSDRDVRNAHHNLVVKWHPDKAVGNQDEASRTVARINEAYNALRTAESRGEYEARRSTNGGCGRGGGVTGDFKGRWNPAQLLQGPTSQVGLGATRNQQSTCHKPYNRNSTHISKEE
jgi:hypothetical protein